MNCHWYIRAQSPKLLPIRETCATGLPVPRVKVHDLPDSAYLNHSTHVTPRHRVRLLSRQHRQEGGGLPGAVAHHGVAPGQSSPSGAVPPAGRPGDEDGLRPRRAAGEHRSPAPGRARDPAIDGLLKLPPLEGPARTNIGPEHAAEGTMGGASEHHWRSLEDLARRPDFEQAAGRERPVSCSSSPEPPPPHPPSCASSLPSLSPTTSPARGRKPLRDPRSGSNPAGPTRRGLAPCTHRSPIFRRQPTDLDHQQQGTAGPADPPADRGSMPRRAPAERKPREQPALGRTRSITRWRPDRPNGSPCPPNPRPAPDQVMASCLPASRSQVPGCSRIQRRPTA